MSHCLLLYMRDLSYLSFTSTFRARVNRKFYLRIEMKKFNLLVLKKYTLSKNLQSIYLTEQHKTMTLHYKYNDYCYFAANFACFKCVS